MERIPIRLISRYHLANKIYGLFCPYIELVPDRFVRLRSLASGT